MTFALYPAEKQWWSFQDYAAVLDTVRLLGVRTVLEFGPGSSTLALIEGGATHIDCLEDNPTYFQRRQDLVQRFPKIVSMHAYKLGNPLPVVPPAVATQTYDLGLVDGPVRVADRPQCIEFALARCTRVLVPTDDYGTLATSVLRPFLTAMALRLDRPLRIVETGPLAGGFALFSPPHPPPEEPAEVELPAQVEPPAAAAEEPA